MHLRHAKTLLFACLAAVASASGASAQTAEEITSIDLNGKGAFADQMVIANGRSNRHVSAIADQLVEKLKAAGFSHLRVEGVPQCDWVLVDSGDVVVHLFRPEVRSFYNLEKLWSPLAPDERIAV